VDHIHTPYALKVFKISYFCIWWSFGKTSFRKIIFGKYRFCL